MSDLRDAVALLSRAVELLAIEGDDMSEIYRARFIEVRMLAKDARGIAETVNGVAGKSNEL